MKNLKERIIILSQAAEILKEMVTETEAVIPDTDKHITDRLGITVSELSGIVISLKDDGVLDSEFLTGAQELVNDAIAEPGAGGGLSFGIPMYWTADSFNKTHGLSS